MKIGFAAALGSAVALAAFAVACSNPANSTQAPGTAQTTAGAAADPANQPGARRRQGCDALPNADKLKQLMKSAVSNREMGGLNDAKAEWAAVVDRSGELCATVAETDDVTTAWPGSIGIAKAKAFTANAFSSDTTPMSTARLYTLAQPGHSLFGAAAADPFDPSCLTTPDDADDTDGKVCGGVIVFGGGLPLYSGQTKVGALGMSGDTSCADHEIAKHVRDLAGLNPPGGASADDIIYSKADGPLIYAHPLCPNTWRDGKKVGEEAASAPAGSM